MQTTNANPPIRITGRHVTITEAMKDCLRRKLACLHLDYPRIVDVHAILDIEKYRHTAEVILRCSNHITIKASAETEDMYASLDQVVDRVARKMWKYHTRVVCTGLPRRHSVRTGPTELRGLSYGAERAKGRYGDGTDRRASLENHGSFGLDAGAIARFRLSDLIHP